MAFDYLKLADRTWPTLIRLMGGHAKIYRATNGLIGHRVPGVPEMLLLDHVGAKSGTRRTTPLVFARDPQSPGASGSNVILIASKGGYPKSPAWFYNLKANPDTTIQIGSKRMSVHARVATSEEYDRLWKLAVDVYGGYEDYRRRTERKIPLVVLEPR
ncbi:MAG TPA: nitroreductase family deazaflavin-dependent oxidoreductase [Solirubrobacteraceae bacterium]|jgi:deazaflavin-dependent oxidoreductase (nitroreductase family)|nr:nitroreductase family deazaflavin-dependent oxidoreductase [Solirubrobacteraceae bacterium]